MTIRVRAFITLEGDEDEATFFGSARQAAAVMIRAREQFGSDEDISRWFVRKTDYGHCVVAACEEYDEMNPDVMREHDYAFVSLCFD